MLGFIVCTHAGLASGLYDAVNMIAGKQEDFYALGFEEGEDMLAFSKRIQETAQVFEQRHQQMCIRDRYKAQSDERHLSLHRYSVLQSYLSVINSGWTCEWHPPNPQPLYRYQYYLCLLYTSRCV